MNSEWQLHRIGLLDFWYYDEQEFYFVDGRMLLRGANGSGKSVTMQSFLPLLLDGNMRPERLDPFGSRARKMENYLLEEDDDREERTGYLYMELKRVDSDVYTTIGIGMRARKNKKLESWYFCITDGRRVGHDIFLYKEGQNKITCTKLELKNRIGEGGRVMETQSEYIQCVNRLLFGFETIEEYREMLDLLIQLRTPKLSKDFKPTVINEILSGSLQTLSEEDLRPMSEAIENMDSLKTNLDLLNDSVAAAKQIEKIYNQYNEIVLYEKAVAYTEAIKSCKSMQKKIQERQDEEETARQKLSEVSAHYDSLEREELILKREEESLNNSDAARLKKEEVRLSEELEEKKKEEDIKKSQEAEKKEKQIELEQKIKKQSEENEILWDGIEESFDEMEQEIEGIPFDEFSFMKQEILAEPESQYNFQAHNQLFREYQKKVEAGKAVLTEAQQSEERYNRFLQELDEQRECQEKAERECRQYEDLLHTAKEEWVENFYKWEKANQEIHLQADVMQAIARRAESYQLGTDFSEIRDGAKQAYYDRQRVLWDEKNEIERKERELSEEKKVLAEELNQWRNQKDPEPECSDAVKRNRELLQKKGIPYLQLYKTIDFDSDLDETQAARIEEALEQMGLLDALIVSEEYRSQIRALDEEVCDKYIFSDVSHVRQNMLELLDVDNAENDILLYQNISNVLLSIGYQDKGAGEDFGNTWIDAEGNYRIGILEGTVTGASTARYIGVKAREKYRQAKIQDLELQSREIEEKIILCTNELEQVTQALENLEKEWKTFPGEEDLKVAAKELAQREYALENVIEQLRKVSERTERERVQLDEIRIRVREVCSKCYLTARLDVFTQALEALSAYKQVLIEVQINHEKYRSGLRYVAEQQESVEALEQDLDNIRYELGMIVRKVRELEAALFSVSEQLRLTDYEEIKERLERCVRRLNELPRERETAFGQKELLANEIERLGKEIQEQQVALLERNAQNDRLEQIFAAEYRLGYVPCDFVVNEDMQDMAEKVYRLLNGKFGNKKQVTLQGNLQEVYHQNRAYLLEYNLTLQNLFVEMEEQFADLNIEIRRIDITAKYRGTVVQFKDLIVKLQEDAEEQSRLLSDRDRELFEDILANTISKKIRGKIQASKRWVEKMNILMQSMHTSSGLKLSLNWKNKRAEKEEQLGTRELVELLEKDYEIMREDEAQKLSGHFRSKIAEARKLADEGNSIQSFYAIMRDVLDYRRWFEFQLECQKTAEKKRELTDRVFFTFSGGEKAMAMYVPLFSAVVAKYAGARADAPKLISLDEAFAGVDETNIRDMFRLMITCNFNFMINSQVLWGDYDTVPGLAIYQLLRPENAKFVTVIPYVWNGKEKILQDKVEA